MLYLSLATLQEVSLAYGSYLTSHQRYSAAGLIYSRGKHHLEAAQAFCSDLDWQSATRELQMSDQREDEQLAFLQRFAGLYVVVVLCWIIYDYVTGIISFLIEICRFINDDLI